MPARRAPDLDWPPRLHFAGGEYVKYAEVYDALYGGLDRDADFYLRCARERLPDGGELLELGAGTGRLTERLLRAGFGVTAVDASPEMLALARRKLARFGPRCRLVRADAGRLRLGRRFALAIAPFGMVAHLLEDRHRLAAYKAVRRHLVPGGRFVLDDMPGWMTGPSDGARLDVEKTVPDRATGGTIRLSSNAIDAADRPVTARYDIIDWLDRRGRASRRVIVRVLFRDIPLRDELRLLERAGFVGAEILGGFDGRPFDRRRPSRNKRLIIRCRAPR
ncbi:MAG: class I SAM-dependent methyltransferase [Elusimicrobia bacterium]|nr:class I SAM-dependent methyltransferase [Elusimicrobiota bacterium]